MKERIETRDGQQYVVTVLPKDRRLTPSAGKQRAMFSALSSREKAAYIDGRIRRAKAKKRRRRKRR